MDLDNEITKGSPESEETCGCGCNGHHDDEGACCGDNDSCGCGGGCDCGCGHDHEQYLTLVMQDDTKLKCRVIGAFDHEEHSYIALLHPTEGSVFLFRYYVSEDQRMNIEDIESDEEYKKASEIFMSLYGC